MRTSRFDGFDALAGLRDSLSSGEVTPEPGNSVTTGGESDSGAARAKNTVLALFFERKGRGGKEATIIAGMEDWPEEEVKVLAAKLKARLGTGGSARGGEILLQGDRRDALRNILPKLGFIRVKG